MITTLELVSAPCFGDTTPSVGPLTTVNFFFGGNGAGKTTISRTLADLTHCPGSRVVWEPGRPELDVQVYNRDYVDRTIRGADALPGVFLLGEVSVEAQAEIDALAGPAGTIAQTRKLLDANRMSLGDTEQGTGKRGEIKEARAALAKAAWAAKRAFPAGLGVALEGYNGSVEKLVTKVIEVAGAYASTEDSLEELITQAASVFSSSAVELPLLPQLDATDPTGLAGSDLLGAAIIGSEDGTLAELIGTLGNSDWVDQGREFFSPSDGRCPFCQQETPKSFADELQHYFDARFARQRDDLAAFIASYRDAVAHQQRVLDEVAARGFEYMPAAAFAAARATFDAAVTANEAELGKKTASPSTTVTLTPLADPVAALHKLIAEANTSIGTHNDRVRNRKAERGPLIVRCWRHLVRGILRDEVTAYETAIGPLRRAEEALQGRITETSEQLRGMHQRLTELQKRVRSSKRVIDDINATLTSVGFTSFRLAESAALPDGYSLIRPDGVPVEDFLSEGERTFITFLYYYHQLRDTPTDTGAARNIVAVIDDPISSLDSDILFVVSTLTRDIIRRAHEGEGRVRQVIVLTHNTQFHKEVTYARPGTEPIGRSYFTLKKIPGRSTRLTRHPKNPVKTPYQALWDDVRAAGEQGTTSVIGLENTLRRIVENYFRTMGGMSDREIIEKLDVTDQVVGRSLFSWMNDGSHTIPDPLDFSPTGIETATYLRVFEEVFAKSGHHGHYLMMTGYRGAATDAGGEDEPEAAA